MDRVRNMHKLISSLRSTFVGANLFSWALVPIPTRNALVAYLTSQFANPQAVVATWKPFEVLYPNGINPERIGRILAHVWAFRFLSGGAV